MALRVGPVTPLFDASVGDPSAYMMEPGPQCRGRWGHPPEDAGGAPDALSGSSNDESVHSNWYDDRGAVDAARSLAVDPAIELGWWSAKLGHDEVRPFTPSLSTIGAGDGPWGVWALQFIAELVLHALIDAITTPTSVSIPQSPWYVECSTTLFMGGVCTGTELVVEPRECLLQLRNKQTVGANSQENWMDVPQSACRYNELTQPQTLRSWCEVSFSYTLGGVVETGRVTSNRPIMRTAQACFTDAKVEARILNRMRSDEYNVLPAVEDRLGHPPYRVVTSSDCKTRTISWEILSWEVKHTCPSNPINPNSPCIERIDRYFWDPNSGVVVKNGRCLAGCSEKATVAIRSGLTPSNEVTGHDAFSLAPSIAPADAPVQAPSRRPTLPPDHPWRIPRGPQP